MMNERIKELYDLAIGHTLNYHDENPKATQKELDRFCAAEFSGLIVQECYSICEELGDQGLDGHYCADEIKRTFGVE